MAWTRPRNWGKFLLAVWLIAAGGLPLVNVSIPWAGLILSALAIAAGILILMGK